ncbi:MAG: hypothetical protein JWL65_1321 [Gammaproteobacteria bacterium]|nr:hypothetical protein [Gammaproteobacteria bacterium]
MFQVVANLDAQTLGSGASFLQTRGLSKPRIGALDAWDCDSPHSRAAAEKLPSRATRVKSRRANTSFMR